MPHPKKETTIREIQDSLSSAEAVVLADYRGLSASQMEKLRLSISEAGGSIQVIKNTLLNLALTRSGYDQPTEELINGPTAVIFSPEDLVPSIKALYDYSKDNELPVIKGGYLGTSLINNQKVISIAKLPPIEVLHAQLVGQIQAPISSLVRQLNGQLTKLVLVVNTIKDKKS